MTLSIAWTIFKNPMYKLFFGVTMMYFAPIGSTTLTVIKRYGRSLLALPICVVLIGCDNAEPNDHKDLATQVTPVDSTVPSNSENAKNNLQDNDDRLSSVDDQSNEAVEGQSLIAAAQPRNEALTSGSRTTNDTHSNILQATLMGDYGGMVPCTSCDSVDITLNLFADGSVLKTSIYNNPDTPHTPLFESGIYRQDNNITIVYEDKNIETYRIQDNHLILMNKDKSPNNDYTLSRK
ncbi:copper resistance protein NlpE N-terminal domain-containing protein [Psychrobacter sp. AOP29-E1-4]|uniref:copper resistance protein NlpE N-terminal domain-containing protein n=1 Tax=Psychrobacter sp. AOP29-E1-4 TaxID=3457703 RepID=UPI004034FA94